MHGKNIYGIVDQYPDFPFLVDEEKRKRRKKAARLYIYFSYGKISKNI